MGSISVIVKILCEGRFATGYQEYLQEFFFCRVGVHRRSEYKRKYENSVFAFNNNFSTHPFDA